MKPAEILERSFMIRKKVSCSVPVTGSPPMVAVISASARSLLSMVATTAVKGERTLGVPVVLPSSSWKKTKIPQIVLILIIGSIFAPPTPGRCTRWG
ncbi:MAG: hypothetical protein QHH04_09675 [Methanolinea sp.]|nr:hypothetical protein [Methanolinea sp.]